MAIMKYWNGSSWVELDAKDADTLDGKHASDFALSGHTHSGYASSSHNHDGTYLKKSSNLSDLPNKETARSNLGLTGSSNTTHYHDSRYYTRSQVDSKLSGYLQKGSVVTPSFARGSATIPAADRGGHGSLTINFGFSADFAFIISPEIARSWENPGTSITVYNSSASSITVDWIAIKGVNIL